MFMDQIDTNGGFPNFKGAAIGDGCWGNRVGTCAFNSGKAKQIKAEFFQGHGMYDQPLYAKIKAACGAFSDTEVLVPPCSTLIEEMNEKVGEFDVYNIYDTCGSDRSGGGSSNDEKARSGLKFLEVEKTLASDTITIPAAHANTLAAKRHPQLESKLGGALNDYPCGGESTASEWLAQPDVVKALHVNADGGGMTYKKGPMEISGDLRPLYAKYVRTPCYDMTTLQTGMALQMGPT
jgi:cathepsin A (carboxypeptidase C)/serine carboxypeptidase-like clade 1